MRNLRHVNLRLGIEIEAGLDSKLCTALMVWMNLGKFQVLLNSIEVPCRVCLQFICLFLLSDPESLDLTWILKH